MSNLSINVHPGPSYEVKTLTFNRAFADPREALNCVRQFFGIEDEPKKKRFTRDEILEAARQCVSGDREQDYGNPEYSFTVIAELWTVYLRGIGILNENDSIYPRDVAALMTLFKMARVATGHNKADNWIDAAGYAACGGEIESRLTE